MRAAHMMSCAAALVVLSMALPAAAQQAPKRQKVTLDFRDAPIDQVVRFYARLMDQNFIIARDLSDKRITVLAPRPVSLDEAWAVFTTALAMNHLTTVQRGRFLKIIDARDGPSEAPLRALPDKRGGMGTHMIPLENAPVGDIEEVLGKLVSPGAKIIADPNTNSLIIVEHPDRMRQLRRIIKALDKPEAERRILVVPLQHADAEDMARILEQITTR